MPGPTTQHYNDWPNTQGFDVEYEQRQPVELTVTGQIPAYAAGVLFRTGPGPREIKTKKSKDFKVNHWFDYMSVCHRFQIHEPVRGQPAKVTYNSRSTCDGLVKQIQETGKRELLSFGAKYDPCTSFFKKAQSFFKKSDPNMKPDENTLAITMNVNHPGLSQKVNGGEQAKPAGGLRNLVNRSDNDFLQMLDPQTLEPIGIARQETLHPELSGPSSGTHAKSDPSTGDVYNYNLDFVGGSGKYRVFVAEAATGKVHILATISAEPAYLHSMFLTQNYAILCVWNSTFMYGGASILWNKNVADAIGLYDARRRPKWYVVDRTPGGRGLVATFDSDPFFAFHSVNAYEEPSASGEAGKVDIVADVTAYDNLDIIKRYYIDNLLSDSPTAAGYTSNNAWRAQLRRFRLPDVPSAGTIPSHQILPAASIFSVPRDLTPELPVVDPRRVTRSHRFIYGVVMMGKSTLWDGLVKYDISSHDAEIWMEQGQSVSEPLFVPNPDGTDEDDGVLLSVVLDGFKSTSYLLVLDARDLHEVARATVEGVIGHGFHGTFVQDVPLKGVEAGVVSF